MRIRFIGFILLVCFQSRIFAGGFPTLKIGVGARPGGMGMAYTALADDGEGGFWNPAGSGFIRGSDLLVSHHRWFQDVQSSILGFGWGKDKSGGSVYVLYTEVEGIEQRTGPTPDPLSTFSTYELVGGLSLSRMVWPGISIGIAVKALYEKLFVEEVWGFAGDIGVIWEINKGGIRAGAVLQNIGKTGRLGNETITLPLTGKLGVAIPIRMSGGDLILAADGIQEIDFPFHFHLGAEYQWKDMIFFRAGYQTGYEIRDVTAGIGIVWKKYRFGYGYMPYGEGLDDSHRLSFGLGW